MCIFPSYFHNNLMIRKPVVLKKLTLHDTITKQRKMAYFVYSRNLINQFCDHFTQNTLNVTNKLACLPADPQTGRIYIN